MPYRYLLKGPQRQTKIKYFPCGLEMPKYSENFLAGSNKNSAACEIYEVPKINKMCAARNLARFYKN
jgi:hypothetical protein